MRCNLNYAIEISEAYLEVIEVQITVLMKRHQDLNYASSWGWFLKPRAQAKEKKLLENFHAVTYAYCFFLVA